MPTIETPSKGQQMDELKKLIREVPDYPKPGILFYDLTTLLKDKSGLHMLVDRLCEHYANRKVDLVVGVEARGFIFAPALAYRLGAGFVPVRKPKKLAGQDGLDHLSARIRQRHAGNPRRRDQAGPDRAAQRRFAGHRRHRRGHCRAGAPPWRSDDGGAAFAVELTFLNGRAKLPGLDVFSLLQYDALGFSCRRRRCALAHSLE